MLRLFAKGRLGDEPIAGDLELLVSLSVTSLGLSSLALLQSPKMQAAMVPSPLMHAASQNEAVTDMRLATHGLKIKLNKYPI